MKTLALVLSLSLMSIGDVFAAYQPYSVRNRISMVRVDEDGGSRKQWYETRYEPAYFRVEVVGDSEGLKAESSKKGRPFIGAVKDERFAVRLNNPLPVRVAVNLTVDGINSISGKPTGIADGEKWMIDPYSTITIRGWQVTSGEARRFFFTNKPKSYAKWTGDQNGKDLSVNCGVIGAAYFWNQKELDRYYDGHPVYQYTQRKDYPWSCAKKEAYMGVGGGINSARGAAMDSVAAAAPATPPALQEEKAGTGMGERESNPTTLVDFQYDTGMYQVAQAIVIYYDFAQPEPTPNPFPTISFAPEMP